jgi:hypothetical protein
MVVAAAITYKKIIVLFGHRSERSGDWLLQGWHGFLVCS